MRVPNSPHNLKKVMLSYPKSENDSSSSGDEVTLTSDRSNRSGGLGSRIKRNAKSSPNFQRDYFHSNKSESSQEDSLNKKDRFRDNPHKDYFRKDSFPKEDKTPDHQDNPKETSDFYQDKMEFPTSTADGSIPPPHRSRERTRRSAVLKLLERKQLQKEKEKEKAKRRSSRARSCEKEAEFFTERHLRSHSTDSRKSTDEIEVTVAKTYISIGPGKPTRIREHSPVKSPNSFHRVFTEPNLKSKNTAQDDKLPDLESKRRSFSPSPIRSSSLLKDTSPLKSADLLKDIPIRKSPSSPGFNNSTSSRKRSFTTEKTILINNAYSNIRKMSVDDVAWSFSSDSNSPRSSSERECKRSSPFAPADNSSRSNSFSSTSSLSSVCSSSDNNNNEHLTKRRVSLEERFKARASKIDGKETASNTSDSSGLSSASSRLLFNLSSGYRYHRAAAAAASTTPNPVPPPRHHNKENESSVKTSDKVEQIKPSVRNVKIRRYSHDHSKKDTVVPKRKISLPPTCYENQEMKKSLAESKKDEGNDLFKRKKYREALHKYTEAINLSPSTSAYYGNRSACHIMLLQFKSALDDATTSVNLDPSYVKGLVRVAKASLALGRSQEARDALKKAEKLESHNSAVQMEMSNLHALERFVNDAKVAREAMDFRKCLYCLDCALSVASASRQLKLSRCECLAFLGRHTEASELANSLLRQDSTCVEGLYVRGLCLYYEDNVEKAFSHFQQVLRLAPDHQKAKEAYKRAKLLNQKKEEGNELFKSSKWSEAYRVYTDALEIDTCNRFTNAKLYCNRAIVAAKLNKLEDSISDCTKALELDDGYQKALLRRAKSYMDTEKFEEAVRDYEKLNRMDRFNQEYRRSLQQAKLELKKSKRKDYYKILGIVKGANEDEIKKAYRKRALVHHPDRHANATDEEKKEHERKFKEIGEAYGILSDAKKRAKYDSGYDLDSEQNHDFYQSTSSSSPDFDPSNIFDSFFSGGGASPSSSWGGAGLGGHHFSFGGMPSGFSFQFG